jgi:anti-sigma factor ChrR (cupin superfamily)
LAVRGRALRGVFIIYIVGLGTHVDERRSSGWRFSVIRIDVLRSSRRAVAVVKYRTGVQLVRYMHMGISKALIVVGRVRKRE